MLSQLSMRRADYVTLERGERGRGERERREERGRGERERREGEERGREERGRGDRERREERYGRGGKVIEGGSHFSVGQQALQPSTICGAVNNNQGSMGKQ